MQKRSVYSAWDGNPPNIQLLSTPMPDAPYLPLTGGGTARMSLDSLLGDLERDLQKQTGRFFEYVWESEQEEADTYSLQSWEVCRPDSGIFEAVVVLYYFPLNPYLTLRKHMGQDAADEYQDEMAAFTDEHSPVT